MERIGSAGVLSRIRFLTTLALLALAGSCGEGEKAAAQAPGASAPPPAVTVSEPVKRRGASPECYQP